MRLQSTLLVAALLTIAGACKTVRTEGYPAEYVSIHGPTHVWVTQSNNSVVELWNPTIHGDTMAGFNKGAFTEISLADVKLMRASEIDPTRTALLAGGTAIGTAAIVATLMGSGSGSTCITPGTDFVTPCPGQNGYTSEGVH
ncbi:MAG TPA: hypothetical protein VLV45_07410 [Gemmatimonadales bacterium]|nr:hypothetical protein [Gemmatimonadales bacterium]